MKSLASRLVSLALVGIAGCGDSDETPACTPGESQACACPSGDQGAQSCKADGSGFDVCVCEGVGGGPGVGGGDDGGSGGGPECAPGEERDCYEGAAGTENVGTCVGGMQTCQSTKQWGDCAGQVLPTTDLCISPEDEDCDGQPPDCPSGWQVIIGDDGGGGVDIAVGPDDSVVVVGWFTGTLTLGGQVYTAQSDDVYVVKIAPDGEIDWVRTATGLGGQSPMAVAVGPSGEVVVGGIFFDEADFGLGETVQAAGMADAFLWGLDAGGTPQWVEVMGTASDQAALEWILDVAIDADGNIGVVGWYTGLADFAGAALPDAGTTSTTLVAKLDPQHSMVFYRTAVLTGYSNVAFQTNGDLVASFKKPVGAPLDLGGGPILEEAIIASFAPAGDLVWAFPFGASTGSSQLTSVLGGLAALGSGVLYHVSGYGVGLELGGATLPQGGLIELALTGTGAHAHSEAIGEANQMGSRAAASLPDGGALFGGDFAGGSSFTVAGQTHTNNGSNEPDAFVVRVDPDGMPVDARTFGTPGAAGSIQSLGATSGGDMVLLANWEGEGIDFGFGPLPKNFNGRVVVARRPW